MRTTTINGHNVTYPDKVVFAFNPTQIEVESDIEIIFYFGNIADRRQPYKGKASIDISKYLQSMFEKGERYKAIDVRIYIAGVSGTVSFNVLWGAMNIGERFNGSHDLTWFGELPMKVPVYIPEGGVLLVNVDWAGYTELSRTEGLYEVDMAQYKGHKSIRLKMLGAEEVGVFDKTFDYTFMKVNDNTTIVQVDASECDEGIYLRWVDRHGFLRYYLFQKGEVQDQSKAGTNVIENTAYEVPVYGMSREDKTMVRSIHIGAPLVNKDTLSLLRMLETSPIVDMYVNGYWIPVRIKPGTTKETHEDLVDYDTYIVLPDIISQTL